MLIFFAKFSKFSKTSYKNSQTLKNTTKNVIYAHAKNKIFKIFKNVIYAHRHICGLVKVDFDAFSQIQPTWGAFFRPTVGRAPIISSINERIRISAFQCMPARPKRIRIVEVTIGNAIP